MVVARLTTPREPDNVKYMSRFIFAAASSIAFAASAGAQLVPGRDLLEFPLGTLAGAPALTRQLAGGLWNPSSNLLGPADRLELGFAALTTPYEQGVESRLLTGAFRLRAGLTGSLSFAQASVGDILKTETDPQSFGDEIPYSTMILSAGLAKRRGVVALGVAARYRWGTLDTTAAGAASIDAGVTLERTLGTPVRLAASTFLFSPTRDVEAATYLVAADVPLLRSDTLWTVRAGASFQHTEGHGHESYFFSAAAYRGVDATVGMSRSQVFGNVSRRLRVGLGLRYAKYRVAYAREDGAAGIGASNQFLITTVFR